MNVLDFLLVARAVATFSKDRNTQVGAVAIDDNMNIIATGHNGFPRKVDETPAERHERPAKYQWTSHAEENLVAQAAYAGHSLKRATVLVTTLYPCATCARLLIQSGVRRIIAPRIVEDSRWAESNKIARTMFSEANLEVEEV